jgi:AmmeMemoRadiSam system protein A
MDGTMQLPDRENQRRLLARARTTAAVCLTGAEPALRRQTPHITGRFGGVFVTFWHGHKLRGCVGTFAATEDVLSTIEDVTASSLTDPRFADDPITADEFASLEIEVSLLTDPVPVADPLSLCVGKHGIVVRLGEKSGCFLPKVATEKNWTAEEFLRQCCVMKAGLPPDAWRDREASVCLFEAHAFREPAVQAL